MGSNRVLRGPSGAVLSGLRVSTLWLRVTQAQLWKWLVGALVGDIMRYGMSGGENLSQAGPGRGDLPVVSVDADGRGAEMRRPWPPTGTAGPQ